MNSDCNVLKTCRDESQASRERKQWWMIIVGLALAYFVLWRLQIILGWFGVHLGPSGPPSIVIWNWLAIAGLLTFVLTIERRPLRSIGFGKPRIMDFAWVAVFWVTATMATSVAHALVSPPPSEGLDTMMALSIPMLIAIIVTASITEEIVFRGYIIERLRELTGYVWIAALISFALFVVPHVQFFGPYWLIHHSWGAAFIYILYVWRGNLWACMLLHLLQNALILIPALGLAE